MFLLVLAHPGSSGQRAVKRLFVCVSLKYLSVTAEMKLILTLLCCNCFPFQLACCTVYIVHALYQLTCMLKDSVMISWVS